MGGTRGLPVNRVLIAVACIACFLTVIQRPARSNDVSDEGFVPLFNGKDRTGWQTKGDWVYEQDGALAAKPQGRRRLFPDPELFLYSDATYDDFILDLEFKVETNSSSGVFLRSSSTRRYIQVQIRDSYGKKEPFGNSTCCAVVGVAAPSKNLAKPAGQWNRMVITCDGNQMQVRLNGEEVIKLDLSTSEKTRDLSSGHIAFENTNTPVAFRNAKIKVLRK
jgi:hypothetical protein